MEEKMGYLNGTFRMSERRWIIVAALVLLPVFFLPVLPVWTMRLWAPQYPEGLTLTIYANTIQGDLQKINILNHYVGMHPITPNDFKEFSYMPQLLTGFGVMALLAALVNRRWLAILGWLGFTAFAVYMFRDYANWLWHYGHDLDPRAAIKLDAFTPPLIGYKRMANFRVWSLPGPGTFLLGAAWLLGPIVFWLEHRAARRAAKAALPAVAAVLGALLVAAGPVRAATIVVPSEPGAAVAAVSAASPGDTVRLLAGAHRGPLRIDRTVFIHGEPGAVVSGEGDGTVILIAADGVVIEDLAVQGSGNRVVTVDSGIRVGAARRATLRRLVLRDVLYGIVAERTENLRIEGCRMTGRVRPLDESGDGSGIHLWYTHDAELVGNTVERFQDGIYLSFADRTSVSGNRLESCGRYGLHTMYCQDNRLEENRFARNVAGCAIMFSNHLLVRRNSFLHNRGPRTYGLLLRDCSAGEFVDNYLVDNTVAVFMDNSNRNRIHGNLFQDNGWGLLIFSSCAGNETSRNSFLNNDYPVALDMRYSDNRFDDGARGNFWSENAPYDLNSDGVSDVPYSPVSAFAFLSKQHPDIALLAKSPAVAAITVAERVFPALRPSEIVDRYPLVAPSGDARGPVPDGDTGERRQPVWAAFAGSAALLATGLAGILRRPFAR
jgi:nitrous oxidase accessory protein